MRQESIVAAYGKNAAGNMEQRIWLVMVLYHPPKTIYRLLEKLKPFPLILVANSQLDQKLKNYLSKNKRKIIQNFSNCGFAAGFNRAATYTLQRGAKWVVNVNQDIIIKENLINFTKHLSKGNPSLAGPIPASIDPLRYSTILPKTKNIDYLSGAILAIHKSVFSKIGMFYEPYFMYYEDVDYSFRAKKNHIPLIYYPFGFIEDDGLKSEKQSFLTQYYLSRNHMIFLFRHAPLYLKLRELVRLPKTIWQHYQKRESAALLGLKDFFLLKRNHFIGEASWK